MEREPKVKLWYIPVLVIAFLVAAGVLVIFMRDYKGNKEEKKTIKILCVGNSFNQDVMAYLPPILNAMLPDVSITYGSLYSSGASLEDHINWYREDKPYTVFNYWKPGDEKWTRMSGKEKVTLKDVLALEDWNFITIQGNTKEVTSEEGVSSMLDHSRELMGILRGQEGEDATFVWFEWISRSQDDYDDEAMYRFISDASKKAMEDDELKVMIPVGTAMQSARTNPDLAALGESDTHNLLYKDNIHMQAGLPALLATYTTALKIAEWYGEDPEKISFPDWLPTPESVREINASNGMGGGMTHGDPQGVTEEHLSLIKKIALSAVLHPGTVTDFKNE